MTVKIDIFTIGLDNRLTVELKDRMFTPGLGTPNISDEWWDNDNYYGYTYRIKDPEEPVIGGGVFTIQPPSEYFDENSSYTLTMEFIGFNPTVIAGLDGTPSMNVFEQELFNQTSWSGNICTISFVPTSATRRNLYINFTPRDGQKFRIMSFTQQQYI